MLLVLYTAAQIIVGSTSIVTPSGFLDALCQIDPPGGALRAASYTPSLMVVAVLQLTTRTRMRQRDRALVRGLTKLARGVLMRRSVRAARDVHASKSA